MEISLTEFNKLELQRITAEVDEIEARKQNFYSDLSNTFADISELINNIINNIGDQEHE